MGIEFVCRIEAASMTGIGSFYQHFDQRLLDRPSDYAILIDMAFGCDYVLLGEATHGTARPPQPQCGSCTES